MLGDEFMNRLNWRMIPSPQSTCEWTGGLGAPYPRSTDGRLGHGGATSRKSELRKLAPGCPLPVHTLGDSRARAWVVLMGKYCLLCILVGQCICGKQACPQKIRTKLHFVTASVSPVHTRKKLGKKGNGEKDIKGKGSLRGLLLQSQPGPKCLPIPANSTSEIATLSAQVPTNTTTFLVQASMLSPLDCLWSLLIHQPGTNPMSPSSILPWRIATRRACPKQHYGQSFCLPFSNSPMAYSVILNGKHSPWASALAPSLSPPHTFPLSRLAVLADFSPHSTHLGASGSSTPVTCSALFLPIYLAKSCPSVLVRDA